MTVFARDDPHKFERKMGPYKFASYTRSVLLKPPCQVVRGPDVDVIVPAPKGVYAPPVLVAFHTAHYPSPRTLNFLQAHSSETATKYKPFEFHTLLSTSWKARFCSTEPMASVRIGNDCGNGGVRQSTK